MKYRKVQARSGYILVMVLLCLIILSSIAAIALVITLNELRASGNYQAKTRAFYLAEGGLNRSLGQITRGYLDKNDQRFIAFDPLDSDGLFKRYVDNPNIGLQQYQGGSYMSGKSQGLGTVDYKVVLNEIAPLGAYDPLSDQPRKYGRNLKLQSEGTHRQGAKAKISQQLVLSYLPNVIFKYGMLTHRLKECQFCHMHVLGDIGQVGGEHFGAISPHVTMGVVSGNVFLSGVFKLNEHPAHRQLIEIRGRIIEKTKDPNLLPKHWPSLLSRDDPKNPEIAGFYSNLVDKASLIGLSSIEGGEILVYEGEQDRFKRVDQLRKVVRGHVILQGTAEKPILLNGPLVIKGDLILRGMVSGQGSLYVERNIYIIGDVFYSKRPLEEEWGNVVVAEVKRRNEMVRQRNFKFDKLGLFAGGNVILGNLAHPEVFRYIEYFLNYESSGMPQEPNNARAATEIFEKSNQFDPLGIYVMDGGQGQRLGNVKTFRYPDRFEDGQDYDHDGNKTWGEGMRWIDKPSLLVASTGLLPAGASDRDFNNAWISRSRFDKLASIGATTALQKLNRVSTIDATIYTDGAFTGFKPSNDGGSSELFEYSTARDVDDDGLTFNGAVIARDVDVLAPGGWYVKYDNRNYVGEGSMIDFEPSRVVEITGWHEE